jgi:hypothetical protein
MEHADLVRRLEEAAADWPEVHYLAEAAAVIAQQAAELERLRAGEPVALGVPWWQIAKDHGCWTDKTDGDMGLVHFGSTEALRVFVTKITAMAYLAGKQTGAAPVVNKFGDTLKPEWQSFMRDAADHLNSTALPLEAAPAVEVLDAKRYRWLKDVSLRYSNRLQAVEVHEFISPIAYGPNIDEAIDAAIAATQQRSAEPPQAPTADLVERVAAALYEASCEVGQREHLVPHAERFQTLARAAIAATKEPL